MKSILIVEDELMIAMFNKYVVEQAGHKVLKTLTKGEEAVEFVRDSMPDLILMDIMLEGEIDGIEAMMQIRKFSNVPVIYVTGNSNPAVKDRAFQTNYTGFIVKPANPGVLADAVNLV
jgi:CheY-like chemotaxis protein